MVSSATYSSLDAFFQAASRELHVGSVVKSSRMSLGYDSDGESRLWRDTDKIKDLQLFVRNLKGNMDELVQKAEEEKSFVPLEVAVVYRDSATSELDKELVFRNLFTDA